MGRTRFPPGAAAAEAVGWGRLEGGGGVMWKKMLVVWGGRRWGRHGGREGETGEARADVLFG